MAYCISQLSDLSFFNLSVSDRLFNNLKYKFFRLTNKLRVIKYCFYHYQDNRLDYSEKMLTENSPDAWYYGYFQGERYFYDNEDDIIKCFQVKTKYEKPFKQIWARFSMNKKFITIHIRKNDYTTFDLKFLDGPDLSLPMSYYHQVIKQISLPDAQYIIISDNIDKVKDEFSYLKNVYYSELLPIIDLQFLIHSDICILSNSTFSWWGAWLNMKTEKIIFAPGYFLGFKVLKEYPINIIPEKWIRVPVNNE